MTVPAAALLDELHRRGAKVRVLRGDALEIRPRWALDDRLRAQLRARKAEVVALLRGGSPGPTVPPPCSTCGGSVWWQGDGTAELHCAGCVPCPDRSAASWYASPTSAVDVIVNEMIADPLVRHALNWSARSAPTLADGVIAALGRIERAGVTDTAPQNLYHQLEAALDDVLRAAAGLSKESDGTLAET